MLLPSFFVAVILSATSAPDSNAVVGPVAVDQREEDAGRVYEQLMAISVRERRIAITAMTPVRKASIWAHHFLTYLATHPEFTEEQKAVIQEALSLLTPEFFAITAEDPQFAERVDKPLQALTRRAREVFPPALALELFVHLGPERRPERDSSSNNPASESWKPAATVDSYCECSTISDWCEWNTGLAGMQCDGGGCWWRSSGCGTLLQYSCTGMCVYHGSSGG